MSVVFILKGGKWGGHRIDLVQKAYAAARGAVEFPLRAGESLTVFRGVRGGMTPDSTLPNLEVCDVSLLGDPGEDGKDKVLGVAKNIVCPSDMVMGMRDAMKGMPFVMLTLASDGKVSGDDYTYYEGAGREVRVGVAG